MRALCGPVYMCALCDVRYCLCARDMQCPRHSLHQDRTSHSEGALFQQRTQSTCGAQYSLCQYRTSPSASIGRYLVDSATRCVHPELTPGSSIPRSVPDSAYRLRISITDTSTLHRIAKA
eukprot:654706-Rhodomonas_salina.4